MVATGVGAGHPLLRPRHVRFDHPPKLHALVDDIRARLRPFEVLDPIPRRWLHLTMAGVGHVADVPAEHLAATIDAVRHQLRDEPRSP